MAQVDISTLTETAIRIQKDLKMLPYAVMAERLGAMGMALVPNVQNKDVLTYIERKGSIAKPYVAGTLDDATPGKTIERILEVFKAYASVKDNIQNYKTVIVGPDQLLGKNQSKKHPWEKVMLSTIIRTFAEDILYYTLFHGERDTSDATPTGIFNGFHTVLDALVAAGTMGTSKGNYDTSVGAITAPSDESDVTAANQILAFYRLANPELKKQNTILLMSDNLADIYDDAYFNKFRMKPTYDEYGRAFLHGTNNRCRIVRSNEIGDGNRMILTVPGNLQLGMDSMADQQFVQVRQPYEDPNYVQFWIQADYGVRVASYNKKMLFMNNQSAGDAQVLSGDYS